MRCPVIRQETRRLTEFLPTKPMPPTPEYFEQKTVESLQSKIIPPHYDSAVRTYLAEYLAAVWEDVHAIQSYHESIRLAEAALARHNKEKGGWSILISSKYAAKTGCQSHNLGMGISEAGILSYGRTANELVELVLPPCSPQPPAPPTPAPARVVRPHGNSRAVRKLRKIEARTPTDALSAFGDFVPWDS